MTATPTTDDEAITALRHRQPHGSEPYGNFAVHTYRILRQLRNMTPGAAYGYAIAMAELAFGFADHAAFADFREGDEGQQPSMMVGTAQIELAKKQGAAGNPAHNAHNAGGDSPDDSSGDPGDRPDCIHSYSLHGFATINPAAYENYATDFKPLYIDMAARHMMGLVAERDGVGGEEWRGEPDYEELAERAVRMSGAFVSRIASEPYPLGADTAGADEDQLDREHGCSDQPE